MNISFQQAVSCHGLVVCSLTVSLQHPTWAQAADSLRVAVHCICSRHLRACITHQDA
jgi:hypothetical protein